GSIGSLKTSRISVGAAATTSPAPGLLLTSSEWPKAAPAGPANAGPMRTRASPAISAPSAASPARGDRIWAQRPRERPARLTPSAAIPSRKPRTTPSGVRRCAPQRRLRDRQVVVALPAVDEGREAPADGENRNDPKAD